MPIIPDEARTFGMDALFRELKIYAALGQKYEPVDHDLLLSYTESNRGQILEEGITEAGSMASFIAAGTSYAHRGVPMVPFYTFYSMFGFQRVGDLIWQAADARARGFLLGATAGRTTLLGEGLQHQDGHSLVLASTVPPVQAYDPAFAYEVAAIVQAGLHRMFGPDTPADERDVFYYLTLYNENYVMPPMPEGDVRRGRGRRRRGPVQVAGGVPRGPATGRRSCSRAAPRAPPGRQRRARRALRRRRRAVVGDELQAAARGRPAVDPLEPPAPRPAGAHATVAELLADAPGPIVAVTDFMAMVPEQIARFLPGRSFMPLGTDGMGRSDTREALRRFFEIDTGHVVVATLAAPGRAGRGQARGRQRRHRPLRHRPRGRQPLPRLTRPVSGSRPVRRR